MKRQAPQPKDKREPKLVLNRESIRPLTDDKLEDVVGGIRVTTLTSKAPCEN
jgi:hypothetical protein